MPESTDPLPQEERKAILLAISGPSSSGKTTLARLLRDIFPRAFVLHLDDFYKTDAEIPVKNGLQDWDCAEAINLPAFQDALTYIQRNGYSPPDFVSKEDQNSIGSIDVDKNVIEDLKWTASKWMFADAPPIAIIDGFLLYSEDMKPVRDLFDVKLFLKADFKTVQTRRKARSGYVTLEGFWEDPEGYVEEIVWPNYVADHKFLFKNEDVEGEFDEEVLRNLGIRHPPSEAKDMTSVVRWGYEVLDGVLDEFTSSRL